ncbi:MAG: hypothetical protein ABWX67_05340 [Allosphingosinicella sp.]
MDWLFKPIATSNYLVACANIVALATAAYFGYKSIKWISNLAISIYKNRVKEFLRQQRQLADNTADICVDVPSYFIAVVVRRGVIITICVIMLITNTIRLNAIHTYRHAGEMTSLPMWISGDKEYNFYSLGLALFLLISFFYLNSLVALSNRVRRRVAVKFSSRPAVSVDGEAERT